MAAYTTPLDGLASDGGNLAGLPPENVVVCLGGDGLVKCDLDGAIPLCFGGLVGGDLDSDGGMIPLCFGGLVGGDSNNSVSTPSDRMVWLLRVPCPAGALNSTIKMSTASANTANRSIFVMLSCERARL